MDDTDFFFFFFLIAEVIKDEKRAEFYGCILRHEFALSILSIFFSISIIEVFMRLRVAESHFLFIRCCRKIGNEMRGNEFMLVTG